MKSIATLLLLFASSFAHDAVIFSSTIKIKKDAPVLTSLIASASAETPLVFFVNPDFVLGQFSKAAAAYSTKKSDSSIVRAAKAASYAESRFVPSAVHVPSPSPVSVSSPLEKGQSVYLVSAENWSSLDKLAAQVLAVLEDTATVVVTSNDVVSTQPVRVKRVAAADGVLPDTPFPVVIPKVENEEERKPCLFYLEGLTFVYKTGDGKYLSAKLRDNGTSSKKYGYSGPVCPDEMAVENDQLATFSFSIAPGPPVEKMDEGWSKMSTISMELTFRYDTSGWWGLKEAKLTEELEITFSPTSEKVSVMAGSAMETSMKYIGINSVFGYSWNCWDSQALFFRNQEGKQIGVSLHGVQIAVYGKDYNAKDGKSLATMSYFGSKVDSCTGTFSVGSWMGIITALVLIAVFMFGFLMLNSVQTLDRYDDPKQKQMLINVRE